MRMGVSASAEDAPAYVEVISNYVKFDAPANIGVSKDGANIAVFDNGNIKIIANGTLTNTISTEQESCYGVEICGGKVFALLGSTHESALIYAYEFDGTPFAGEPVGGSAVDISSDGSTLYVLLSLNSLKCYTIGATATLKSDITITPFSNYSVCVSAWNGKVYLQTVYGKIVSDNGDGFENVFTLPVNDNKQFSASSIGLINSRDGEIYKDDVKFIGSGDGDEAISSIADFAVSNDKIFVLDNEYSAIKIFNLSDGEFSTMIGTTGSDVGRFKSPTQIAVSSNNILVNDPENGRVVELGPDAKWHLLNGAVLSNVTDIAFVNDVYVLNDGELLTFKNYLYANKIKLPDGITASKVCVTEDKDIFIVAGQKVFCKKSNATTFSDFCDAGSNVKDVVVGLGGEVVYVLTDSGIQAYTADKNKIGAVLSVGDICEFEVDYKGNVFTLSTDGLITKYVRTLSGYGTPVTINLGSANYTKFGGFTIDSNGDVYITADSNILLFDKTALGVVVAGDSGFEDNVQNNSIMKICETLSDAVVYYVAPDNLGNIEVIASGTKCMVYASLEYDGNEYLRIETKRGTAYILKSEVTVYEEGEAPFESARCLHSVSGVNIYRYPSKFEVNSNVAGAILYEKLGKDKILSVKAVVAEKDGVDVWGFLRVEYDGKTGYVLSTDVRNVDNEPVPITRYAVKAKSDGLGKTVIIYEDPSQDSTIVTRLADGAKIYALEKLNSSNEFTKVLYGGKVCYALTANLTTGGLTAGQTLAIVLCAVTVTFTVLVLVIKRSSRRRKI